MEQYFDEISTYNITKDNIIDFLIDKENSPDFTVFKNFIMDMAEMKEYNDLYNIYYNYKNEGYHDYIEINNSFNSSLSNYINGTNNDFTDYLMWIKDMSEVFNVKDFGVDYYFNEIRKAYHNRNESEKMMRINTNEFDNEKLEEVKSKSIELINEIKNKIRNNNCLKEAKNGEMNEVEKYIDNLDNLARVFSNKPSSVYIDLDNFSNKVESFNNDLFFAAKTAKDFKKILNYSKEHQNLESITNNIRNHLMKYANSMRNPIKREFRTVNIDRLFNGLTPKYEDVPKQFKLLSKQFDEINKIEDVNEYIKKCADFHFDFLKVHPFMEGNGRTSRLLLKVMLGLHEIYLPSLYSTEEEKYEFYDRSNDALKGNYKTTENDLLDRLGKFYPLDTEVKNSRKM